MWSVDNFTRLAAGLSLMAALGCGGGEETTPAEATAQPVASEAPTTAPVPQQQGQLNPAVSGAADEFVDQSVALRRAMGGRFNRGPAQMTEVPGANRWRYRQMLTNQRGAARLTLEVLSNGDEFKVGRASIRAQGSQNSLALPTELAEAAQIRPIFETRAYSGRGEAPENENKPDDETAPAAGDGSGDNAALPDAPGDYTSAAWFDDSAGMARGLEIRTEQSSAAFLMFETDWCGYCRRFNSQYLTNPVVTGYLEGMVKVRINPEDNAENRRVASQYGVRGYPTLLVLPADGGDPVRVHPFRRNGQMSPEDFVAMLDAAARG